jgi:hypothetical protein
MSDFSSCICAGEPMRADDRAWSWMRRARQSMSLRAIALLFIVIACWSPSRSAHAFMMEPAPVCIEPSSDYSYFVAYFGYESFESSLIQILVGAENSFSPGPADLRQPTVFLPGFFRLAFRVNFAPTETEPTLTWNFNGRTVTASWTSPRCVSGLTQTIVFGANPNMLVYSPNLAFNVSATGGASGNPVTFTSRSPSICTIAGNTVTVVQVGGCVIAAIQAGNEIYAAAAEVRLFISIARATQATLTVTSTSTTVETGSAITLGSTGGSGTGAVTFASNSTNCTIVGTTLTGGNIGSCNITATKAADVNYFAATSAPITITVTTLMRTVTGVASPSVGGVVSCISPVNFFATSTCTVTANSGFAIGSISGCGGTASSTSPYTTGFVSSNCTVTATFVPTGCRIDVNGDNARTASVDGLLILRYLLGFRGAQLLSGLPSPLPGSRTTETAIENFLSTRDLNVRGLAQAATAPRDGLVILRYLQNQSATVMIAGTDIASADATAVFNRLQGWCP